MSEYTHFSPRPYSLLNQIQHYAWGTRGGQALIPRLLGQVAEPGRPYAELWLGGHPKAPSSVQLAGGTMPLPAFIRAHPEATLGRSVLARFGETLPFLFKVLSIGAPLSIQAHPNKAQARLLHARDPEHYPDANHKPEIAIALDTLQALVGFRPYADILKMLATYPAIAALTGSSGMTETAPKQQEAHVRRLYTALMQRALEDEDALSRAIEQLEQRLQAQRALTGHEALFLEARQTYTGADVGLLTIFFLNLVHVEQGQGLYLRPGVPHAYLKGNIVECMANSDNVVRAGLTPKFKDVPTLLDILDYALATPPTLGTSQDVPSLDYSAAVPEFSVRRWRLTAEETRQAQLGNQPHIWLVTEGDVVLQWGDGQAQRLARGQAVFIPASLPGLTLCAPDPAEVFQATVS